MNRKDREMTSRAEILELLERCDTIRLGLSGGEYPYVVPVSFGLELSGDMVVIYFHSAKIGQKVDLIRQNQNVCIEADIFHKVELWKMGITTRYESVIGLGIICEVDGEEKVHGLQTILEHYGHFDYPLNQCRGLSSTSVYKIVLHSLTGKRNLSI